MHALPLLLLAGCLRFSLPVETGEGADTAETGDTGEAPLRDPRIVWGDLHNHTNLSHDGCEDPENACRPDFTNPGEATYTRAAAYGLGFAAITDHAEFVAYARPEDEIELDTWTHMRALVEGAEGTGTFGIMGYEWTSSCTDLGDDYQATHRTVLIEEPSECAEWRIPSCHSNGTLVMGAERYVYSSLEPAVYPSELHARLEAVPEIEGCGESRWAGFFHHVAQERPAWVDWASAESWVPGDTVVEIASEHGSSECDLTNGIPEGCEWRLSENFHVSEGSIQYMLQMGHELGFVGGTDNHMDEPGRIAGGPGNVRDLQNPSGPTPYHEQFSNGTLTGAITYEGDFDRADLFDTLAARHTVVASWPAGNLVIYGTGADGVRYLPGDDVPVAAMPMALTVTMDDATIDDWYAELVDPFGALSDPAVLDIPAGEIRYVRIRAFSATDEHRVFASPFFVK